MRKLLITLDFPPETGGIQRYLHELVVHTFHRDDMVLTTGTTDVTCAKDIVYPCRIIRLRHPLPGYRKTVLIPMLFLLLRIMIREKDPIVIMGGNIYAAILPCIISYFFPVIYMVYCYGTELMPLQKKYTLKTFVWKEVLRHAIVISYLTSATRRLLVDSLGERPYVQNVPKIDLPDFYIAHKVGDSRTIKLLSVGRLVPHKGHSFLIEAVGLMDLKISWQLIIVGNGPEYQRLTALTRKYGLEQKISIQTATMDHELSLLYKESSIFILPSIETGKAIEGFGIVLLEAMSYGTAIIASQSGGIPDVFKDSDECALLIPPGNPEMLCHAITELSLDIPRRLRMIQNARCLLERRYVW